MGKVGKADFVEDHVNSNPLDKDRENSLWFPADMAWGIPQYKRGQVDRAGAQLIHPPNFSALKTVDEINEAMEAVDTTFTIINNWRSSHSYPLHIIKKTLHYRARKVDENAIIAQRLKRLSSIAIKLRDGRNKNMKLSQMQDIGGCRAILGSVDGVDKLVRLYAESVAKNPHDRPELIEKYDYIAQPKPNGYRSVHFVYKYRSKSPIHEVYSGLRIEIQLRSQLQHAWATAVETVSTFTGQALKSNIGDESWMRFFALMGSAIALREERPFVQGTPENKNDLVEELRSRFVQLNVGMVLRGWSQAVQMVTEGPTNAPVDATAFLLVLDSNEKTTQVTGFRKNELAKADEEYLRVEKQNTNNPNVQAVLVSVDSLAALRSAYPNYYLDTSAFLEAVRLAVE